MVTATDTYQGKEITQDWTKVSTTRHTRNSGENEGEDSEKSTWNMAE